MRRWRSRRISSGRDDGFISVGDPVSIKFDTFPFIQYGLAYGTVRTISADSFTSQDEQRNPTGSVPVPSNSGESVLSGAHRDRRVDLHGTPPDFRVMPGMPVTADIKVGKRTVLQYLLGRVLAGRLGRDARAVRPLLDHGRGRERRNGDGVFSTACCAALSPAAALRRAVRLIEQGNAKQAFPLLTPRRARRHRRGGIPGGPLLPGRCRRAAEPDGRRALARARGQPGLRRGAGAACHSGDPWPDRECGQPDRPPGCSPPPRRRRRISRPASAGRARRPKAAPPMARRCSGTS